MRIFRDTRFLGSMGATVASLLLCFILLAYSLGQGQPVTPDGVQCPTAATQTVTVVRRSCCGKLEITVRTPRPGDKGFVQCRCAEKKSAQNKISASPKLRLLLVPSFAWAFSSALLVNPLISKQVPELNSIDRAPKVRPPDQIQASSV